MDFKRQKSIQHYADRLTLACCDRQTKHKKLQEHLYALAEFYCQGYTLDGEALYDRNSRKIIHLPTYPFARNAYWVREAMKTKVPQVSSNPSETIEEEMVLLCPEWRCLSNADAASEKSRHIPRVPFDGHWVIFCESESTLSVSDRQRAAREWGTEPEFFYWQNERHVENQSIANRYTAYAVRLLKKIQQFLRPGPTNQKTNHRLMIQLITPAAEDQLMLSGLAGLIRTAQLENPKILGQVIEISPDSGSDAVVRGIKQALSLPHEKHLRCRDEKVLAKTWHEQVEGDSSQVWKPNGVYLITGGMGGLGRLFAQEAINACKEVRLVLTGRSALKSEQSRVLAQWQQSGASVEYIQADVADAKHVEALFKQIDHTYGALNGIFHAAGVLRDNFIHRKTEEELQAVFAPKVAGTAHLDWFSRNAELDFFVLFSSGATMNGNVGQADYAAANAFMDAFAEYRNRLVDKNHRRGHTLAVNWPLWSEGGMQPGEITKELMFRKMGIVPLRTRSGMEAFYKIMAVQRDQVMIMAGVRQTILDALQNRPGTEPVRRPSEPLSTNNETLKQETLTALVDLVGHYLKLDARTIDPEESMERYGIDSLMITELNGILEDIFGEISKTLFFEYKNLTSLAGYFVSEYPDECARWVKQRKGHPLPDETKKVQIATPVSPKTAVVNAASVEYGASPESIAIIGMSGRYPLSENLDEFWDNLSSGKHCVVEIPEIRWPIEGFYVPDPEEATSQGRSYSKWGGFIESFANFDAAFFNISPREAFNMDPQERLFIQTCWEVLEDAGYTREMLARTVDHQVGVFVGITKTGFDLYGPEMWRQGKTVHPHTSFGSVANRVSYLFDFKGPSLPIDTMCSSSLTAVHEACEHLIRRECRMAIAGGVNLYVHPSSYVGLCANHMLSTDGRCKSFGKGGDGFVPGEGVGAVLLKPLSMAKADQDTILAVIRGTSINHGGKTNGYTVPNPNAQQDLIRKALDRMQISARSISYVEGHGTGTALGDPIEITGLEKAFKQDTQENGYCAIGSVKSNIGHSEAAAGIAGLSKVVLQLKNRQLVPSLHAKEINPNINLSRTPFFIQQNLTDWTPPTINGLAVPLRATVSSFGAGGANAFVVVEEYDDKSPKRDAPTLNPARPARVPLSAKNSQRLTAQVRKLLAFIDSPKMSSCFTLADLAYTLQVGREAMQERIGFCVTSLEEFTTCLRDYLSGKIDNTRIATASQPGHFELLSQWVCGNSVDWMLLYQDASGTVRPSELPMPRRIQLPTYAFEQIRYWFPDIKTTRKADREIKTSDAMDPHHLSSTPPGVSTLPKSPIQKPNHIVLTELGERRDLKKKSKAALNQVNTTDVILPQSVTIANMNQTMITEPFVPLPSEKSVKLSMEEINASLVSCAAEALLMKQDDIDEQKSFVDLGMDSIIGVEWIRMINKTFGTDIKATKIYDFPNIKEFATHVNEILNPSNPEAAPPVLESAVPVHLAPEAIPEQGRRIRDAHGTTAQKQTSGAAVALEDLINVLKISLAEALMATAASIDEKQPFVELGLDSIVGVEWIRVVNQQFGTAIAATKLYDFPNLSEFAEFFHGRLDEKKVPHVAGGPLEPSEERAAPIPVKLPENAEQRTLAQYPVRFEATSRQLTTHSSKEAPEFSIEDILSQVENGVLDIEKADELIRLY